MGRDYRLQPQGCLLDVEMRPAVDDRAWQRSIIHTSSGWGILGGDKAATYCAAKGGLVVMAKAMAIDHGPDGFRINCVCPGDVETPMLTDDAANLGIIVQES